MVLDTVVVLGQLNMFKLKDFVHYYVVIHAIYIYIYWINHYEEKKQKQMNVAECTYVLLLEALAISEDNLRKTLKMPKG